MYGLPSSSLIVTVAESEVTPSRVRRIDSVSIKISGNPSSLIVMFTHMVVLEVGEKVKDSSTDS